MKRKLIDYTDILDIKEDKDNNIGLITLRDLYFLDVANKGNTVIKNRGTELVQYKSLQDIINDSTIELDNIYTFNELNQIVFVVPVEQIQTFCSARDYVTGLELVYPMKEVKYTTGDDNATYDLKVTLSSNGEILHVGDNMSFSEICNVIKILDNKINLNSFGYDIYEIKRSLDIKK